MAILIFRICLLSIFLIIAYKKVNWRNWQKYYPTALFVVAINLFASFLTYHHSLWVYAPCLFVKSQTTVELINSFVILPLTTFIYLSNFPETTKYYQYSYILLWVLFFGSLEFIDHFIVEGISYKNSWSWPVSVVFDVAMFSIIRIHYLRPIWAWALTLLVTGIIVVIFNFFAGQYK